MNGRQGQQAVSLFAEGPSSQFDPHVMALSAAARARELLPGVAGSELVAETASNAAVCACKRPPKQQDELACPDAFK